MNDLYIIGLTLIIYSIISTVVIEVSHENDNVIEVFGYGIVGCLLIFIGTMIRNVYRYFKYCYGKRSIFIEENTGNQYKCKIKDVNDIRYWTSGYKLINKYANKSEWRNIPDFDTEFIEDIKRNCDHCKYDEECECDFPYNKIKCKHDKNGAVLEFNRFVKK